MSLLLYSIRKWFTSFLRNVSAYRFSLPVILEIRDNTNMDTELTNKMRGIAVGAVVGDALGMPLEFKPPRTALQP